MFINGWDDLPEVAVCGGAYWPHMFSLAHWPQCGLSGRSTGLENYGPGLTRGAPALVSALASLVELGSLLGLDLLERQAPG